MTAYLLWVLVVGGGSNFSSADISAQPYVVPLKFVHLKDCQAVQKSMQRLSKLNQSKSQCVQVLVKD